MRFAAPGPKARPSLRAVLYHHIANKVSALVDRLAVSTAPDVFEAHVRRLERNYEIVSLDTVLSGRLPRRALLITFDDGYRSFVDVALPTLRRLGLPSVLFVTGACLDPYSLPLDNLLSYLCVAVGFDRLGAALDPTAARPATFMEVLDMVATMPYDRRLSAGQELAERFEIDQARLRADGGIFLGPEDLRGLAADGCEVANHTRSHVFCRSIVDEASAQYQLVEHARRLESLTGHPVRAFSFPYGRREDATPMVERVLRESGHEALFLAESRPHLPGSYGRLWNRVALDDCPAWRVGAELDSPLLSVDLAGRNGRETVESGIESPPQQNELELAPASDALADLSRAVSPVAVESFLPFEDALSDWRTPRTTAELGPRFPALLRAAHAPLEGDVERNAFNRALVAYIASRLRFRLAELALPDEILELVPPALNRLRGFLSEQRDNYELGDEYFLKDVRFAAGWSVPCGAKVVDLRCRISLPVSLLTALRARALRLALRTQGPGHATPWFEQHTDSRYLDDFNEAGMDRTYLLVAALLPLHPEVAGLTAYSWFYDPQLDQISPRLSYLRRRPLERGAFVLRGHTSHFDVKNATATSQTRKRLYEAGEYRPVGHRIVWLRRDILRWADRTRRAAGLSSHTQPAATRS